MTEHAAYLVLALYPLIGLAVMFAPELVGLLKARGRAGEIAEVPEESLPDDFDEHAARAVDVAQQSYDDFEAALEARDFTLWERELEERAR